MTKLKNYKQSATVRALMQAGAAEPALPGRRRGGPLGGQEVTRSERPWGLNV